jgi:hypothetical protein
MFKDGVTVVPLVFFSLAFVAVFLKREKYREKIEEWEKFWPHIFTYKELSIATSGFRDENVLGQGGLARLPGIVTKCFGVLTFFFLTLKSLFFFEDLESIYCCLLIYLIE